MLSKTCSSWVTLVSTELLAFRRFTEAAIFQTQRSIKTLEDGVIAMPDLDEGFSRLASQALEALNNYLNFLQRDLLARSDGQWAIGREAYKFILHNRWAAMADHPPIAIVGLDPPAINIGVGVIVMRDSDLWMASRLT